jgi:hypothetical protein
MDIFNFICNNIFNTMYLSKSKTVIGPINSDGEIQSQNLNQQFVIGGIQPINSNGCMVSKVNKQEEKEKIKIEYDLESYTDT